MTSISIVLWAVFVILLILWGIGLLINLTGGFVHLLIIVAVLVLVTSLISI